MRVAPDPILLVSPHLDDAALSCAALLAAHETVHVLAVFGGSAEPPRVGWSERAMGFPTSRETMAARHAEERSAFGGSSHRLEAMSLLDEDYIDGPRSPRDGRALQDRVLEWWADNPGGSVAIPAGAGRRRGRVRRLLERVTGPRGGVLPHADHLFVRDAALPAVASRTDATVVLYEELPYLWGGRPDADVIRLAGEFGLEVEEKAVRVDRGTKAQRIAHYKSQLGHLCLDGRRLDDPACLPPVERYWILHRPGRWRRSA